MVNFDGLKHTKRNQPRGEGYDRIGSSKYVNCFLHTSTCPIPRQGLDDAIIMTSNQRKLAYLHKICKKTVSQKKRQLVLNNCSRLEKMFCLVEVQTKKIYSLFVIHGVVQCHREKDTFWSMVRQVGFHGIRITRIVLHVSYSQFIFTVTIPLQAVTLLIMHDYS